MTSWDPTHYEAFLNERLQPGLDLIARIGGSPDRIVDLGCGAGRLTAELGRRWPEAAVLGIDRSMLDTASPGATYEIGDIETWTPPEPVDLIYSNASLHRIAGHDALFPRLVGAVRRGGTLAVQMPLSWTQPSHEIMRRVGSEFGVSVDAPPTLDRGDYYAVLGEATTSVEVWTTTYYHVLRGSNPVFHWVSATGIKRFLTRIAEPRHPAYLSACATQIAAAYPPGPDGSTIFPFHRLFILATR